jgi:hypothetical protein
MSKLIVPPLKLGRDQGGALVYCSKGRLISKSKDQTIKFLVSMVNLYHRELERLESNNPNRSTSTTPNDK